jgi:hypothetical protein
MHTQGAKPGEGGQLPGKKVSPYIANLRRSKPGECGAGFVARPARPRCAVAQTHAHLQRAGRAPGCLSQQQHGNTSTHSALPPAARTARARHAQACP